MTRLSCFPMSENFRLKTLRCHHHYRLDTIEKMRKGLREKKKKIRITLPSYLCHHFKWSIRLHSIWCTGQEIMTSEFDREREKRGHICCGADWCVKLSPKPYQEMWHLPLTNRTANSSSHVLPPFSSPIVTTTCFKQRGVDFVFVHNFSVCLLTK